MPDPDRPDLTHGPIAILGDGQMALVMADALATRGLGVRMWCPRPEDAVELARTREQAARLPGFRLASAVEVTGDLEGAVAGASAILNAIPTQYIRSVWSRLAGVLDPAPPVICVSKGIENGTLMLPSAVLASSVGRPLRICALSGPTIATELAGRLPASMLAAAEDEPLAEAVQDAFNVPWLRIYTHEDVVGVELAGAAKNVIAIAAGIIDGLGQGDNAKSALLARGLAEIARLGLALGARTETFFGLAGVGDLATTCFSPSGRNRTCGQRIGEGEPLEQVLSSTVSVVEGVPTTRAISELAESMGVDMPITRAVRSVLFDGLSPPEAIRALMARPSKAERVG